MLTPTGPKVIEFNVRLGDPEAQVILPLIDEPLLPLLTAAAAGGSSPDAMRDLGGAAGRRRARVARLSGVVRIGSADRRNRRRRTRSAASPCCTPAPRRKTGRSSPPAAGCSPSSDAAESYRRAIARAYAGVARISFDGMQFRPADIGQERPRGEVLRHHVRLPRESGRLARLRGGFSRARRRQPPRTEDADVVVVNTCSVTASADQAARQTIRRVTRVNPAAQNRRHRLLCHAAAGRSRDAAERPPRGAQRRQAAIDTLVGRDGLVPDRRPPNASATATAVAARRSSRASPAERRSRCACRPAARSRARTASSRRREARRAASPVGAVLAEADRVIAAGFKEIALTGVHLGSYGRDLDPRSSSRLTLLRLLATLDAVRDAADLLFRISSLEPMDCTPDDRRSRRGLASVSRRTFTCRCNTRANALLAAMRRPYTVEYYATLVDAHSGPRCRTPSIGSDIIVGFPGETDADFECLAVVSRIVTADASPRISVLGSSWHSGSRDGRQGARACDRPRTRASPPGHFGAAVATQFRQSQVGTVHRALTLDDGTLAVTGQLPEVGRRIPAERRVRGFGNESDRRAIVLSEHDGELLRG